MDPAAGVLDDALPLAQDTGDTLAFYEAPLDLHPSHLLPNVTQLRAALDEAATRPAGLADVAGLTPALTSADMERLPPVLAAAALRRNVLGTVMFLKLVSSSKYPADQQIALRERFNELIGKALRGVAESTRTVKDTADGVTLCFLGDPEEALQSALLLRGLLQQKYARMLAVRIGLHLGPVRLVIDADQHVTVLGDGINVAQRIMDFAQPNQILVSRAYHDVIARLMDNASAMFSALGPHLDKHLRSHEIHAVLDHPSPPAAAAPTLNTGFENTASFAGMATLTPGAVAEIEADLAGNIGPLAKFLVNKALPRTVSAQGLRELLAVTIADPVARKLFIQPKSHQTQPLPAPPAGPGPAHHSL